MGDTSSHPPGSGGPGAHDTPIPVAGRRLARLLGLALGPVWRVGNTHGSGTLGIDETRELACDGEVQRLVIGPEGVPLDIGRATRVVPPAMRAAVMTRDGGCAAPGCDRPPGWCEAHHIRHWADGGTTALDNLIALCSRHHHELHQGKWRIDTTPATPPQAVLL